MIIAYLKWKNTSRQAQTIALAVVGGVFLILFFVSIWQQYFADNLTRYLPQDSVFWTYFSLPKVRRPAQLEDSLHLILSSGSETISHGLVNLEIEHIDRELALVVFPFDGRLTSGILLRTNQAARLRKIFDDVDGYIHFFDSRTALIVQSKEIADYFVLQSQDKNKQDVDKSGFSNFNSVSLYMGADLLDYYGDDLLLKLMVSALANKNNEVFLNIKAKSHSQVDLSSKNFSEAVSFNSDNELGLDLIANFNNPASLITNWEEKVAQLSSIDFEIWSDYFKSQPVLDLWQEILQNSENILALLDQDEDNGEYSFLVRSCSPDKIESLESGVQKLLKLFLARRFPGSSIRYLSDGARVVELIADPSKFTFVEQDELNWVKSSDGGVKFFYTIENNCITFGNQLLPIELVTSGSLNNNSIILSQHILSKNRMGGYLNGSGFINIASDQ